MSFHSSVDSLHHTDASTEHLTKILDHSVEAEDSMSVEDIRQLLKLPESNSLSVYEDLHTIGIGGFGAVYAAREPGLERNLALKLLRPRYREKRSRINEFIREARITAHISHPNIVPVHRIGVFDDAGVYFSMKRIAGETLRAVLRKLQENRPGYRKKYPLPRLLDIFIGACQGVNYAHQNGILHCDLKPENLMIGDFGEVLVMDWGMARCLPGVASEKIFPFPDDGPSKNIGGTPVYMAPEHLSLNAKEPSIRSDIYALGCVLYSILTWKSSPFEGAETLEEIQKKVVQEKLIPPRRCAPENQPVPRELESICLKAMARDPEKRYESVYALMEDLRKYRDGLPVDAYASSPIYKFSKFFFRRPLVPITFFLSLLVWCGFSVYTAFNDHIYAESLRLNAINSFRNGSQKLLQARKRVNQLKRGTMNLLQMQSLENAIAADAADAEAGFKTTLDILERIPAKHKNPRRINATAERIFRDLTEFYNLTGDDEKLHNIVKTFNDRWKKIFHDARQNNPELNRNFRHALSGIGTVLLCQQSLSDVKWHIEDSEGRQLKTIESTPCKDSNGRECLKLQLPIGLYSVVLTPPKGAAQRIPLRSSLATVNRVDLSLPEVIPSGMIFIPGGEFIHTPEVSNNFRRRSFEGDFLIKGTEVTVGEYLEFWKSLKDPRLKKLYCSYYFASKDSMLGYPAWDARGRLLRPGLSLNHPVTGISGHAAEAFCRYKSKRLQYPVMLPSRAQWSKASGGIDGTDYPWGNVYKTGYAIINVPSMAPVGSSGGDRSIYGVQDLSGNVREFVKVSVKDSGLKGNYAIVGGSFFSHPELARNSNIVYSSRGGNDIGFRYVMPVEKKQKTATVKND